MPPADFHHVPVLRQSVLASLQLRADGFYVDCTAGGGGHSAAIVTQLGPAGHLIAFDRDERAIIAARERIAAALDERREAERPRWELIHAPFSQLEAALSARQVPPGGVDGILADLGVSSHQLDEADRGFSFRHDGPLDMRMDPSQGPTAADLVNHLDEGELCTQIRRLGDENKAKRIARFLVRRRAEQPFERTADLASVVERAVGGRRGARIHPATRTFQALRILVNGELDELQALLRSAMGWLRPGGRLAIITFHSGEDRPVKRFFAELARGCHCPPKQPICTCDHRAELRLPHRRGLVATEQELSENPRARSARLRIAEKLDPTAGGPTP